MGIVTTVFVRVIMFGWRIRYMPIPNPGSPTKLLKVLIFPEVTFKYDRSNAQYEVYR
jgi:hypothetical protein